MKFAQDLWRALLVFVVATLLLERYCPPPVGYSHPPSVLGAASTMAPQPSYAYAQAPQAALQPAATVYIQPPQPERPLRRVAQSFLDLGDSVIGVIR